MLRPSPLSPAEARRVYDRVGAKQDAQGWYEDAATDHLLRLGHFAEAERVVEMGCGTGRLAEQILAAMPPKATYLGTDLSPIMVGLTTERLGSDSRANVQLVDGGPPDLPPASCDRFVSTYVFDLLSDEDARRSTAATHRALVPGGLLCLAGLAPGHTPLSRIASAGWSAVWSLAPKVVGGCRPISLAPLVAGPEWEIVVHERVAPWGIPSEALIARRV
ncbi:MAG: class I SAM-dependent methyltransferase [Bacteroidota bacterium]